jgi:small-conductance mechanosensitive channel
MSDPWLLPILIVTLGALVGWIADRVVRVQLERWAQTTAWRGDEIVLAALKGLTWLWVTLLGIHIAAAQSPLIDATKLLIGRGVEIAFMLSLSVGLVRIATNSLNLYKEKLAFKGGASVITLLTKLIIYTMCGLVILQTEGISITPVLTALGVGGLAVALALQDTLGNIFAGINTLMAGQIRPGDFIKLDDSNEGHVIDIGWRNTSIRTMANNLVVLPNKKLGESVITNYSLPEPAMALAVPVGVAYESDLTQVEQVLLNLGDELMATHAGVLKEFPPAVRFVAFGDSSIEARLVLRVDSIESFYLLRHHVVMAIHARFRAAGIAIAYPTRTVYHVEAPPAPLIASVPRTAVSRPGDVAPHARGDVPDPDLH